MMTTSIRSIILLSLFATVQCQETTPSIVPTSRPISILVDDSENVTVSITPSVAPASENVTVSITPSVAPDENVTVSITPSVAPSSKLLEETDDVSDRPTNTPSTPLIEENNDKSDAPSRTPNAVPIFVTPPTLSQSQSELCELNKACADLGLTGQCCPTIDKQYLYCCNGVIEQTCQKNPQCDALGLEGACCPTAGNIPAEFDGIYLDCCASVPDVCETEKQSKKVGNDSLNTTTTTSTNTTTANTTTDNTTTTEEPSQCVRASAVEYKERLAEVQSTSSSTTVEFISTTMMILLTLSFLLM